MTRFPLGAESWELQDPLVSHMTFAPGERVIRHELFNHWNILWSNLRNNGVPILGNEVQAAPLFPLRLLLSWAPERFYWNLLVVIRLLLAGIAAVLVATEVLKLNRLGAAVFTLVLVYSVYPLRWMNHPWQNALAAGLWYLYFSWRVADASTEKWGARRFLLFLGLSLSVYSMVTSGFPEGAAMSGLLAVLFLIVPLAVGLAKGEWKGGPLLCDMTLGHFVGVGLSSAQIFALTEYVRSAPPGFRDSIGTQQFESFGIFWNMLTRFISDPPPGPIIHFFNLIPLFLFLWGVTAVLSRPRYISRFDFAACAAGLFYILKSFPLWPWFNQAVASLPILSSSWFTVYFLPLLLWSFAYFCARGAQALLPPPDTLGARFSSARSRHRQAGWIVAAALAILVLSYLAAQGFPEVDSRRVARVTALLCGCVALCLYRVYSSRPRTSAACGVLVLLLLTEGKVTRPDKFMGFDSPIYRETFDRNSEASQMADLLDAHDIPLHEVRERAAVGEHLPSGIAAVDNGASAILTLRSQAFRRNLFKAEWDGYLRITDQSTPYSWRLTSANLLLASNDPLKDEEPGLADQRVLGKVGAKFLMFDDRALSRAYVPSRCIVSAGLDNSLELLSPDRFEFGTAVIEDQAAAEQAFCKGFSGAVRRVPIREDLGTTVTLTDVEGPAILVLSDSYYPGWKAVDRISQEPIEIKPANVNFRALFLPERRTYGIQFRYQPGWLSAVYALMGAAIAAVVVAAFAAFRKR